MADTSIHNIDQKKLRENLSLWDAKADPKAPLTTSQKDLFIELTSFAAERPVPLEVAFVHWLLQFWVGGGNAQENRILVQRRLA